MPYFISHNAGFDNEEKWDTELLTIYFNFQLLIVGWETLSNIKFVQLSSGPITKKQQNAFQKTTQEYYGFCSKIAANVVKQIGSNKCGQTNMVK